MIPIQKFNTLSIEKELHSKLNKLNDNILLFIIFIGRYISQSYQNYNWILENLDFILDEIKSSDKISSFLSQWLRNINLNYDLNGVLTEISSHKNLFLRYVESISQLNIQETLFDIEKDEFFLQLEERYISKSSGRFYTPHKLITSTFDNITGLKDYRNYPTVFDPVMGSGRFFIALLDFWFSEKISKNNLVRKEFFNVINDQFFGTDFNNDVLNLAKLRIFIIDTYLADSEKSWDFLGFNLDNWIQIDVLTDLISFDEKKPPIAEQYEKKEVKGNISSKFKDLLINKGFSLILANPPYFKVGKTKYKNSALYSQIKTPKSNVMNIATIFLQFGFHLLAPKGILCYILPKGACYNFAWEKVRTEILALKLLILVDCRKSFQNVLLEQTLIVIQNTKPIKNHNTEIFNFSIKSQELQKIGLIPQGFFSKHLEERFTFYADSIGIDLLKKTNKKSILLKDIKCLKNTAGKIKIFMGDSNNTDLKNLSKNSSIEMRKPIPILWGKLLSRNKISPKYLESEYLTRNISNRYNKHFQQKIVVQRIIAHTGNHIKITASHDNIGCLTINTITNITFIKEELSDSHLWNCINFDYIVLVLNSKLLNFLVHKFYFSDAVRSMDLSASVLGKFLIPMLSEEQQKAILELNNFNKQEDKFYTYLGLSKSEQDYLTKYSEN